MQINTEIAFKCISLENRCIPAGPELLTKINGLPIKHTDATIYVGNTDHFVVSEPNRRQYDQVGRVCPINILKVYIISLFQERLEF